MGAGRSGLVVMSPPGALADRFTVADLQDATLDLSASRLWTAAACEAAPGFQGLPEEFLSLAARLTRQNPRRALPGRRPTTALVIRYVLALHADTADGTARMPPARFARYGSR